MNYYHVAILTTALTLTACSDQDSVIEPVAEIDEKISTIGLMDSTSNTCNRACLIDVAETYLSSLVAHDPSIAPLADNIAFVENITALSPGEGLWESSVTAPDNFAIYVPDEKNQTIGFLGMMTYLAAPPAPSGSSPEEREAFKASAEKLVQPVIVALRLKLENGQIIEAEHLHSGIREDFLSTLQTPREGLFAEVTMSQRMDHNELILMGESYYDALDDNDGTLMPFAEDCERHENGMITAGPNAGAGPNNAGSGSVARDCEGQLTSKVMSYITQIKNRRVFAADPVTGLVMGLSHFNHSMDTGPYEVINTDGSTSMRTMDFAPFDLPAAHIFKIGGDGMVHEIEAMGFTTLYNAPTGWE